jgi:hypothetical protein
MKKIELNEIPSLEMDVAIAGSEVQDSTADVFTVALSILMCI